MSGCSNAFSCALEAWLQAHMIAFWGIIVLAVILFVIEIIVIVRSIHRSLQQAREDEQLREEQENEWKTFEHRTRSVILQGEEWEVDMSDLKASARRLTLMRKATTAIDNEKTLLLFPLMLLTIIVVIGSWIPSLWVLIVFGILSALSVIWWIYHGVKLRRYRWALTVLKQIEASKAKH